MSSSRKIVVNYLKQGIEMNRCWILCIFLSMGYFVCVQSMKVKMIPIRQAQTDVESGDRDISRLTCNKPLLEVITTIMSHA